jgi:Transposase DDE domain
MPSTTTATRPRRKTIYHIRNWSTYDRALVQRGSLTVWISEEALVAWAYQGPRQRGAQFEYSDQAIEAVLTLKEVFHLSNREAEGLVRSVFVLMQVSLAVPDHSTLSRRGHTVQLRLPKQARGPLHVVMDSSGLKVFGEGEWKVRQHGWSKRRTWRKMHLSIDVTSGEVQAAMLSTAGVSDAEMVEPMLAQIDELLARVGADGAYDKRPVYACLRARAPDAEIVIPPRHNARIWQHGNTHAPPHPRDEALRVIRKQGRHQWKEQSGYHQRSLAETAVFRFKTIFGDHLSTRLLTTQASQFGARCRALNIMTHLGMPDSYKVD